MATNTDIQEYISYDPKGKVVKTVKIKGEAGKKIKIEAVSLQLYSGKKGVVNNTVIAVNDTPYAEWNYKNAGYSGTRVYNKHPFEVGVGKDAVLTWALKTSDKNIAVKIKNAAYTHSYVDVAAPKPDEPVQGSKNQLVVIECQSFEKAKSTVEDIKSKGVLTDGMTVYIAKSV